jgi:outer membrane protein OmpA-like peptidoglycan-associated protein
MPSFLDFNSTKNFRDKILGRTLQQPNGPQTFTDASYVEHDLSDIPNIQLGNVDTNRINDLNNIQTINLYKPDGFFIEENIDTLPRRANLGLYPYFIKGDYNLFGIMNTRTYDTESELFKFAAYNIRTNTEGPVYSRIAQNTLRTTLGRVRLLDALNGNTSSALNIITGREPMVEATYSITINPDNPTGVPTDFLSSIAGADNFPISIIPGDYLSNPQNPLNYNSQNPLQLGTLLNDATGVLASMIGIQGKPKISPRPSDIMLKYMGQGQKNRLFSLISYSRYSPNYSILSEINNVLQNGLQLKSPIQIPGNTYIGDDRYFDVKYSMSDFWDRTVRGNYYTSLMFDSGSAEIFHKDRNITEGGSVGGNLTWYSKHSTNTLGANNADYNTTASDFVNKLSTRFSYRRDSILGNTQALLNSLPSGNSARSHVANAMDQTSRIFQEGDVKISRGSAIKYTDKFGQETGVEYCRVWTKDRPYLHLSDTMKRTDIIRKYDGSVLGGKGRAWNPNIAPMSNGKKSFENSSNIVNGYPYGGGFYAKKYMFSIENLAWKTSNKDGFRVSDLPNCEKGPNGGRVMWFPPYDLKVSEQNSARWEENAFLGRPEPIYTYQNTSRSGQISFKVVVDHPSILNLLTREFFKGKSDEEADNYINAFFAGCQDLDFYSLIQTYTTLDKNDVSNIQAYLNAGTPKDVIQKYKYTSTDIPDKKPNTSPNKTNQPPDLNTQLFFINDRPSIGESKSKTSEKYITLGKEYLDLKNDYITNLRTDLEKLAVDSSENAKKDRITIFTGNGDKLTGTTSGDTITKQITSITGAFDKLNKNITDLTNKITEIKTALSGNTIQEVNILLYTSTSEVAEDNYNFYLGVRRAYSIITEIFEGISNGKQPTIKWPTDDEIKPFSSNPNGLDAKATLKTYKFDEFGYVGNNGILTVSFATRGENTTLNSGGGEDNIDCKKVINTKYGLKNYAPIAFFCRQSLINIKVVKNAEQPKKETPNTPKIPKIQIEKDGTETTYNKKPPIDVMKRIIMKTLSECFYFKQLEENSPIAFTSLKEKLKYFHPGFHSTTPEGLNSRLTFLLQCLRPGDTIPIKGLSDDADLNSRNTSFGPPPVCVVRIGDFYHSKIIIRDVNISYEDGPWDMNPEGIGYQPMVATVQLQVSFIGGQGLERPVEKLQNALSSNFFANTEMYDERSESTATTINGKDADKFTKEFLEQLSKKPEFELIKDLTDPGIDIEQGKYIGTVSGTNMDYTNNVNLIYSTIGLYTNTYQSTYNNLLKKYGIEILSTILGTSHRTIKDITVQNSPAGTYTYSIFGQYIPLLDLATIVKTIKLRMDDSINKINLTSKIFEYFDEKDYIIEDLLKKEIQTLVANLIDNIIGNKLIKDLETSRNEVINSIDKVNFLVKYEHDGQISGTTYTQLPLTGFVGTTFYSEYSNVITYLNGTNSPFTQDLTHDLLSTNEYDTNQIKSILSVLLFESKDELKQIIKSNDTFTANDIENINEMLDNFFKVPTEKDFKLDKFPVRKNDKAITYPSGTPSEIDVTDTVQKDNLNKILINKKGIAGVTTLLNFYKG